ncbi:MAG: winged helix-turn-helix domain-containing protein [Candidatus Omnitrophica bacterium]|nr:winged helix-turn-helix domain-containing protein [Candidatus Omnitrophota bacterium]
MIEKIVTSKTRVKLLNLFLTHIDDRYYLRELERMLDESLSPLRRQLLKLVEMGILVTEEEANLKYYKLNKNFEGIDELRKLVLGSTEKSRKYAEAGLRPDAELTRKEVATPLTFSTQERENGERVTAPKRIKYDIAVLTVVSIFVLVTAIFVLYTSTSSMKQVTGLISSKPAENISKTIAKPTRPDEMVSKRWKVMPGNYPAFSTGEIGGTKSSKEL